MSRYEGPCQIDCPERCEVPAGVVVAVLPIPRHNWSDVLICPHGCERSLMILKKP